VSCVWAAGYSASCDLEESCAKLASAQDSCGLLCRENGLLALACVARLRGMDGRANGRFHSRA